MILVVMLVRVVTSGVVCSSVVGAKHWLVLLF